MAILEIPTFYDSPDFTFQITLDQILYGFRFVLNERTGRYSMTIVDATGNIIVAGIAVVTNWRLIERFKDVRLPPGKLFTCDMTGGNNEPNSDNFGVTNLLLYSEALTA